MKRRTMTDEEISKIRIYNEDELHLWDNWEDYAHTIDPEAMGSEALEEVAQIRIDKQLDAITSELMLKIKAQYPLDWFGTHGVFHWHRVYLNGIRLSTQDGVNSRVVQLFSVFHDAQRENEHRDSGHGDRGAQLAVELRKYCPLSDDEFALLSTACSLHTSSRNHENITVQTCFDADRLDIGRVGTFPDADYLCTPMAKEKEIIEWGYHNSLTRELPEQPFGLADFDRV